MSCNKQGCGNVSRRSNNSRDSASPSHRRVHVSLDRSPSRPAPQINAERFSPYAQVAAGGYGAMQIMPTQGQSTPCSYAYPGPHDTFGSQIDYNLSWMPKDINLSELLDQSGGCSSFRRGEQNVSQTPDMSGYQDGSCGQFLMQDYAADGEMYDDHGVNKPCSETLMEWFDRSVQIELRKHKDTSLASAAMGTAMPMPTGAGPDLDISSSVLGKMAEAGASELEIVSEMRKQPDTELTVAVDKLAKAEAMCAFAGAVRAAEAAAEAAPPGQAEEAAVAGARGFQTEVTTTSIRETVSGERPMEILGYVGVTRPKFPIPRNK